MKTEVPIVHGKIIGNPNILLQTPISSTQIEKAVAEVFEIRRELLHVRRRCSHITHPRMLVMFLLRNQLGWSFEQIGQHFGGMHHGSAIHACNTVRNWSEVDKRFLAKRQAVERAL